MTNYEKLMNELNTQHKPFIIYDVETTGVMNGRDNRITQIALAAYTYKNGQYELQDKLFMLAKADKTVLDRLAFKDTTDPANIQETAGEIFISLIKTQSINDIKNCENKIARREGYLSTAKPDKIKSLEDEIANLKQELARLISRKEANFTMLEDKKSLFHTELFPEIDFKGLKTETDFKKAALDKISESPKLIDILKLQGIYLENYRNSEEGLTTAEMQTGITEFLKKYKTADTVFINNGTYFSKHYLEKEGLQIATTKDIIIDLTQAQRSMVGGTSTWTADIPTFAENYKKLTGHEIKEFDAFTKALCLAEIATKATGNILSNRSIEYLENMVKEEAFKHDEGCVMSHSRALSLDWFTTPAPLSADYTFHELRYVTFGDDKRYIDLNKLFEINDNFEVTLEGHKEPIKTWEELEAKIKALNSNISPELLNDIKEKFEETVHIAEEQRKESEPLEEQTEADNDLSERTELKDKTPTITETLSKTESMRMELDDKLNMLKNLTTEVAKLGKERNALVEQNKKIFKHFWENQMLPICEKCKEIWNSPFTLKFQFENMSLIIQNKTAFEQPTIRIDDPEESNIYNNPSWLANVNKHQDEFFAVFCNTVADEVEKSLIISTKIKDKYEREIEELEIDDR